MGVDIMTQPQLRSRPGRIAGWIRTCFISLGLAALLALAYHSAVGPTAGATDRHGHVGAELTSAQRPGAPGPVDPADKKQTSLLEAASREVPAAGPDRAAAPQGPPPVLRGKVLPSEVLEPGAMSLGGCLKEYGENGQCVPVVPPSLARHVQEMRDAGADPEAMDHRWSCAELGKYFQDGVHVRQSGVDPQNLDANGDGTACGPGD